MTNMEDVFGDEWWNLFAEAENAKRITLRGHQEFPTLRIANYTPLTAYEGSWDAVTLAARGLIFDEATGEILARPLTKFFNFGQAGAPQIPLDATVLADNKYDGSLGIIYQRPDGVLAVATRGSFHSEQADHATAVLYKQRESTPSYYLWFVRDIENGYTPLVEIIYPENRIVLDYGDRDYLQPLGWINNSSGAFLSGNSEEVTFGELLARAPRPNAEGYVVWLDPFTAVKIKQADYIALHAIVTNLSEKKVWDVAKADSEIDWQEFVSALPDELQGWAEKVRDRLMVAVFAEEARLYEAFDYATEQAFQPDAIGEDGLINRGNFARIVKSVIPVEDRWAMFSILDSKSIVPKVFDKFKPVGVGSRPSSALADEEQ